MEKMQRIKSSEIKEGMRFSTPVFFDDGTNMFLAEGKPVKQMHLNALKSWNIPYVITYGRLLEDNDKYNNISVLEDIEELEPLEEIGDEDTNCPAGFSIEQIAWNLSTTDSKVLSQYETIVNKINSFFENSKTNGTQIRSDIDILAEILYTLLETNWEDIVSYLLVGFENATSYARSAVATAVFSTILAKQSGFSKRKILQIIIASYLHDIGMLSVPTQVINKRTSLTTTEFNSLQLHALRSAHFASDNLFYPREVSIMIMQHHERWDGSGYPEKIRGESIDIGARIISIADAFVAMISQKTYRESMVGYEAMKKILDDTQKRFDPDLLKLFVQIIGIYPIGSIVLLSNNVIAQVVQGNPEMPFMPEIKILVGSSAKNTQFKIGEIIKLKDVRTISIVRALKPNEYRATA